jgi:hypothetical protein
MLDLHHNESPPSRVRVAFADRALSFVLPKDATFEDLADRLSDLDEWHHGKPVAIEVKLAISPDVERRRSLPVAVSAPLLLRGTSDPDIGRPISAI